MSSVPNMNDPYIKDLLIKFDVLKKALVEERKKTQSLEKKITEMQVYSSNKDNEIAELCKAKHDLESQLVLEKKKTEGKDLNFSKIKNFFKSNGLNGNSDDKSLHYEEKISQLEFEKETIQTRLNKAFEQYENYKLEYKQLINIQTAKLKNLEDNVASLTKENNELKTRLGQGTENSIKIQMEREHFEEIIHQLRSEKNDAIDKMKKVLDRFEELQLEADSYKSILHRHEIENAKLAQKLAEYKNMMIDLNTHIHIFHVTKVNSLMNKEVDIIFGEAEDGGFIMKVKDDKSEFYVNIEDVEYVKIVDRGTIEIAYMLNSKNKKMTILINELIQDQFVQVYNDFFAKNMRKNNHLPY